MSDEHDPIDRGTGIRTHEIYEHPAGQKELLREAIQIPLVSSGRRTLSFKDGRLNVFAYEPYS